MKAVRQIGSVNTKAARIPISLFGLTCNTDVKGFFFWFFNQSMELNAGLGCIV